MFEKYNDSDDVYIIAEVGQNHQGFADRKKICRRIPELGANAIKFQMRNNEYLFSEEAFNRPYDNENSFGKSYVNTEITWSLVTMNGLSYATFVNNSMLISCARL